MDDNKKLLTELLETYQAKEVSSYIDTKEIIIENGKRKVMTSKELNPDLEKIVDTFMTTLPEEKNTPEYKGHVYEFFNRVDALGSSERRAVGYVATGFVGFMAGFAGIVSLISPSGSSLSGYICLGIAAASASVIGVIRNEGYNKPLKRLLTNYAQRWDRLDEKALERTSEGKIKDALLEAQYAIASDDPDQKTKAMKLLTNAIETYSPEIKGLLPPK